MARPTGIKAKKGERMIELKVYFWTNHIAKHKGHIVPKHAWSGGMARLEANRGQGGQRFTIYTIPGLHSHWDRLFAFCI